MKGLLESKKFLATMAGCIAIVAAYFGLDEAMAEALAEKVTALVGVFVGAQGLADMGKKAKAETAKPAEPAA